MLPDACETIGDRLLRLTATASDNGGLTYLYVLVASIPGSLVYFLLADGIPEGTAGAVASACVIFGALVNAAIIGAGAARRHEARRPPDQGRM